MKRDVKVGLFVAAVVIGIAALLLGGGVLGESRSSAPSLSVGPGGRELVIPPELTESMRPPRDVLPTIDPQGDYASAEDFEDAVAVEAPAEELDDPFAIADPFPSTWSAAPALPEVGVRAQHPAARQPSHFELSEADLLALEVERVPTSGQAALPSAPKQVYILQQGETFWDVSRKVYGEARHFQAIVGANPDLDPRRLRPGQRIAIPVVEGAEIDKSLLASPSEVGGSRGERVYLAEDKVHVVQPGELLEDIARTYYGFRHKWPHIQRANPGLDPRRMRVGDRVVVPALTE